MSKELLKSFWISKGRKGQQTTYIDYSHARDKNPNLPFIPRDKIREYVKEFSEELIVTKDKPVLLYFDIETTGLYANFGRMLMFSYCYQDDREPKIITILDDPRYKELPPELCDRYLVIKLKELVDNSDIQIAHFGCVDPEHGILMSNMTYKKAKDVIVGDEVIAFDENNTTRNGRRKMNTTKVTFSKVVIKPKVRITLSDGTEIKCSTDHPFLYPSNNANKANWIFKEAKDFKVGDTLTRIVPKFRTLDPYQAGYIAVPKEGRTTVISIEDIGEGEVMGLSTECSTYISEGFASHNSKFDIKFLQSRLLVHKLHLADSKWKTFFDTCITSWKKFKIGGKLKVIARALNCDNQKDELPLSVWQRSHCIGYEPYFSDAIREMSEYCKQDVRTLYDIAQPMFPYVKHLPSFQAITGKAGVYCPVANCGSENIEYSGIDPTKSGAYLQYRCKDCGTIFRTTQEIRNFTREEKVMY